jgi:hypothetical protein
MEDIKVKGLEYFFERDKKDFTSVSQSEIQI